MANPLFRVLGARRAYQFPPDAIRLTVLTLPAVVAAVRGAFGFGGAQVGMPLPLFGDIPSTIPPGVVFNYGSYSSADGKTIPIRLLHFEPFRVVIDVAYTSDAIEPIFQYLRQVLVPFSAPDGGAAIEGEPASILHHSELTFRLAVDPLVWLGRAPWGDLFHPLAADEAIIATVSLAKVRRQAPLAPMGVASPSVATIELRQGSRPGDGAFYSAAPMPTSDHQAALEAIVAALSPEAQVTG